MTELLSAVYAIGAWILLMGFIGLAAGVVIALTTDKWEGDDAEQSPDR